MIAISTFRPHEGNPEYARNQRTGVHSWEDLFETILLLGDPEPELAMKNTVFIPGSSRPSIKDMIGFLASTNEWGTWINADIVLKPGFFLIENDMRRFKFTAATSFRYTFNPDNPEAGIVKEKKDYGLDVFVCTPEVWRDMYQHIDPRFVKCGMVYDSWMSGFLNARHRLADFTDRGLVLHPKHGGRVTTGFNDPQWAEGDFSPFAGPPRFRLPRSSIEMKV
jgi:hypothetical protein